MINESSRLFAGLEPPAGGLQRLQRTLDSRPGNSHPASWRYAAGAFAMSALALAWLLPGVITQHRQTAGLVSAMRAAVELPAHGIQVVDGAAIELPSGQSDVRLYLVQSAAPATHAQAH